VSKIKIVFNCIECGSISPKWVGQCPDCAKWNTLVEAEAPTKPSPQATRFKGYAAVTSNIPVAMAEITVQQEARISSGLSELDRVLGGGLINGSVVLIGGDPGIGKSTILLQTMSHLSEQHTTLYVTGEESPQQVKLRAERLQLPALHMQLFAETHVERILTVAKELQPQIMVIDSIQTMYTDWIQSAPGSVSQVRESAAQLVRFAKQSGTALFLIGHVTKEGTLAGPRVLEHMVDTVLYFEGQSDSRFRVIRAMKNRFGAVNELGVFAMSEAGLKGVSNPSAIFLSRFAEPTAGSVVMVMWEGTRPLLVEVQALVDESHLANPRRVSVGIEQNRLALVLAVLHRHGRVVTYNQDVFLNVVGGVRVSETASDLAVTLAVLSSLKDKPLPNDLVVFGEVGLAGEIRPVQNGQERLKEAAKHGFKYAIVPKSNMPKNPIPEMEIIGVNRLQEALEVY